MTKERTCLVGHDDDGWIWGIIIALIVVIIIVSLIVYGGAFIGGFYSLKNYFISFKHNVYDSNKVPIQAGKM